MQPSAELGARWPTVECPCIAFPSLSYRSRSVLTRGRLLNMPENSIAGPSQGPAGRAQLTSSFGRRREFTATSPPSDFEVSWTGVGHARFRRLAQPTSCSTLSGCLSSAWPLQHVAFSPSELFDFLHRQLQTKNPYCRPRRYRWTACKAAIGNLLKSGALLSIIEQLDAQQGPSPPKRIEYEAALDELGAGSRLMDYNRPLGELDELDELGECAQPSVSSRSEAGCPRPRALIY